MGLSSFSTNAYPGQVRFERAGRVPWSRPGIPRWRHKFEGGLFRNRKLTGQIGCVSSAIRIRLWPGRRRALGPPHGVLDQFGGGGEVEFLLNPFPVMLDGLDAQMKGARDLARGLPLTDQMQDLAFAIREALQWGGFGCRL